MDKEQKIIESWAVNARNWINIIESNSIESRKLITNKAIVNAVTEHEPTTLLDIGCGEGWLLKALQQKGIKVAGVDVIPALIEKAKQQVQGDFWVASYEQIASGEITFPHLFDMIVINFALIGKESTENLLKSLPPLLSPGGSLLIQTLHPDSRKAINDYVSGWKDGSWDGLGNQFTRPYQWYFRTMENWIDLLKHSGFSETAVTGIFHPKTNKPLSVIIRSM